MKRRTIYVKYENSKAYLYTSDCDTIEVTYTIQELIDKLYEYQEKNYHIVYIVTPDFEALRQKYTLVNGELVDW